MNNKLEFPVSRVENPFILNKIPYPYTSQGIFYADSPLAAVYGNVILSHLPNSVKDKLRLDTQKGLLLLFSEKQLQSLAPQASWSFSRAARQLSLQQGALNLDLPFPSPRLPYEGLEIHVNVSKGMSLPAARAMFCHEYLGRHVSFEHNFQALSRFGYDLDSIFSPGQLTDPAFLRHRRLGDLTMFRSQLGAYFRDVRRYLVRNNLSSVFDIPMADSAKMLHESPGVLLFYRPAKRFVEGVGNNLNSLLPAGEKTDVFVGALFREQEARLLGGDKFIFQELTKKIHDKYPSIPEGKIRGILSANATAFRSEMGASFNQCKLLNPSETLQFAPNFNRYYGKLNQSIVTAVPDLSLPKTSNPIRNNFQWSATPATGFKLASSGLNVIGIGSTFWEEWQLSKQAYPHSAVAAAALRGSSKVAADAAWWSVVAACAGGPVTAGLGLATAIAESAPDQGEVYRKATEPLDNRIRELQQRNASLFECMQLLKEYDHENPGVLTDLAEVAGFQSFFRSINVPGHYRRAIDDVAKSTPEYQSSLRASPPELPVFPAESSLEQSNPFLYPIDGSPIQTANLPEFAPANPVANQSQGAGGVPKRTYTHQPAADAIANVEFKFDANELTAGSTPVSATNIAGTLTYEKGGETQHFAIVNHEEIKQMSLRPINKDTALLPKDEGNKFAIIANEVGTGLALTLATGGTVSLVAGETGVVVSCEVAISAEALSALSAAAPYFLALAAVVYTGFKAVDYFFKQQEHKLKKMLKHSQAECLKLKKELKATFRDLKKFDLKKKTNSDDYCKIIKKLDIARRDLRIGINHEYRREDRSHGMHSKSYHTHNTRLRTYLANLKQCGKIQHSLELRQLYLKFLEDHEDKTSRQLLIMAERITSKKIIVQGEKLQVALTDKDVAKLDALRSLVYRKAIIYCNMGNFKKAEGLIYRLSKISYYQVNAIQSFSILECGSHIINNTSQRLLVNFEKGVVRANQMIGSGEDPVGAILGLIKYIDDDLLPEFNYRLERAPKHGPKEINSSKEVDRKTWSKRIATLLVYRSKLVAMTDTYRKEGNQKIQLDDGRNLKLFELFKDGEQKPLSHWFDRLNALNIVGSNYTPDQQAIVRAGFDHFIMQGIYKEIVAGKLDSAESLLKKYDKHLPVDGQHKDMLKRIGELKLDLNKGANFWLKAMEDSKQIPEDKRTSCNQLEMLIGPGIVYGEVSVLVAQNNYQDIRLLTSKLAELVPGQFKFIHSISQAVSFMESNDQQDCAFWEGQLKQRCPAKGEETSFPQELIRSKAQQQVNRFALALALSGNIKEADAIFERVLPYAYDAKQITQLRDKLKEFSKKTATTPEAARQELSVAAQKAEVDPSLANYLELSFTENSNYEIAINLVAMKQHDAAISHLRDMLEKQPQDKEIILLMIERIEAAKQSQGLVASIRDLKDLKQRKLNLADPNTKERWQLIEVDEKNLTNVINDHANELSGSGYFYLSAKAHAELIAYKPDSEREALRNKLLYEHEVQVTTHFVAMAQSFANTYAQRMEDTPLKRWLLGALEVVNTVQIILPSILTTAVQMARRLPQRDLGLMRADFMNLLTRSWQDLRSPFAAGLMVSQLGLRGVRFLSLNPATSNRIQTLGNHAIRLARAGHAVHQLVTRPGRRIDVLANVVTILNTVQHYWRSWRESSQQRRGDSITDAGYYYRQEMYSAALDWFSNITYIPELTRETSPAGIISGMFSSVANGYRALSKSAYHQAVIRALLTAVDDMHQAEKYLTLHQQLDQYKISFVASIPTSEQLLRSDQAMTITVKSTEDSTQFWFVENKKVSKSKLKRWQHFVLRKILDSVNHNAANIDNKSIEVIKEMMLPYMGENYLILNKLGECHHIKVRQEAPAQLKPSRLILVPGQEDDQLYFVHNQRIRSVSLEKSSQEVMDGLDNCSKHQADAYHTSLIYMLAKASKGITRTWLEDTRDVIINYLCDNFDGVAYQANRDTLNRVRAALLGNLIRDHFQNKNYQGVLSATSKVAPDSEIVNSRFRLPAYYLWREIVFNRLMVFLLLPERLLNFQDEFNQYSFLINSHDPSASQEEKAEVLKQFNVMAKYGIRQYLSEALSRKGQDRLPYLYKIIANYRHAKSWRELLDDSDKLLAAILAFECDDISLCIEFYNDIKDIKGLLAKEQMNLLPMALLLLANLQPSLHKDVCSEENWETYGITAEFAKSHARELVNKKKFYLAAHVLNCNLEFAGKYTLRALCQSSNFKPHDFVNVLKTLLWETDQDFEYWELLSSLFRECSFALKYVAPRRNHYVNTLTLLYLRKICVDKCLEKINAILPEKHLEEIKAELTEQKEWLSKMIEQFETICRVYGQEHLNEERLKGILSATPRDRQTFVKELVAQFSERLIYRGKAFDIIPVANRDENECIFEALGTTRQEAIALLRSHLQEQERLRTQVASRPISYLLEYFANDDQPLRFNADCFPAFYKLLDTLSVKGKLLPTKVNEVGIYNAIAYLLKQNLVVYQRDDEQKLVLFSDQRENDPEFKKVFLLYTQHYKYCRGKEEVVTDNHYTRLMSVDKPQKFKATNARSGFFFRAPVPVQPVPAANPGPAPR